MGALISFFETNIRPNFYAITNSAVRFESSLLERTPGLKAEKTFRAFPPAALLRSDPALENIICIHTLTHMLVLFPLKMAHLAEEWNSVSDKGLQFKSYILPQANTAPGLLLRFISWLIITWFSMATVNSQFIHTDRERKGTHRRGWSWRMVGLYILEPKPTMRIPPIVLWGLGRRVVQTTGGYEAAGNGSCC
ncbi:hypothetical protein PG994_013956 [Apiospora phragmitis]|uniref:Uncharacterized protein n=1 Tax=Apiospora phragmitis TaxID=2905665 RepID=A0ABR1T302_9PEZI